MNGKKLILLRWYQRTDVNSEKRTSRVLEVSENSEFSEYSESSEYSEHSEHSEVLGGESEVSEDSESSIGQLLEPENFGNREFMSNFAV